MVALAARIDVVADPDLEYRDAVVTIGSGEDVAECRTADLPATLFFRDPVEQQRAAHELLGDRGVEIVKVLLGAAEDEAAERVVHHAVRSGHVGRKE